MVKNIKKKVMKWWKEYLESSVRDVEEETKKLKKIFEKWQEK